MIRLRKISDLEIDRGLSLMNGNEPLYIHCVRDFLRLHEFQTSEIRRAIAALNFKSAFHLSHSLRGQAAYLGASKLEEITDKLEKLLESKKKSNKKMDAQLDAVEHELGQLVSLFKEALL